MTDYRVTVTLPADHRDTASAIGRAMDIDVGGADSFIENDGVLTAQTWASAEFATMFQYFIENPSNLYIALLADYEYRWPDIAPPSEEDIRLFCENATMSIVCQDTGC